MAPDDAATLAADAIRNAAGVVTDPAERSRLAIALAAEAITLATETAEPHSSPAERARVAADVARIAHAGWTRAVEIREVAVRQAIRDGWSDSDLSRTTGIPQPRIARTRARLSAEGEPVPRHPRGPRPTRRGGVSESGSGHK